MYAQRITRDTISAQDYERFIELAQQAIAPDLWRDLATQRPCDGPRMVGRRIIGAGYRALFGWTVVPAAAVVRGADGSIGCSCQARRRCCSPGKHPLGLHGQTSLPTTPSLAWVVDALVEPSGYAGFDADWIVNLALLTGQRSASLLVADIDPRHDGSLDTLWEAGWPQQTPIEQTGGGGWHVYTRWPFAGPVPNDPKYLTGIELKGDGLLVIVAPSYHASGRLYAWLRDHAPWQTPLATLPAELAEDLAARVHTQHAPAHRRAAGAFAANTGGHAGFDVGLSYAEVCAFAARRYFRALEKAIGEGEGRNNTAYWLARQLQALGLSEADVMAWVRHFGRQVSDK